MKEICNCEKCKPLHEWVGHPVPSGTCKVCGESHGVDMVINYCSDCLPTVLPKSGSAELPKYGMSEYQARVAESAKQHGLYDVPIANRMLHLTSELGEVAKEIIRLEGVRIEDGPRDIRLRLIGYELSDMVWNIAVAADYLGIDLASAMEAKCEQLDRRWREKNEPEATRSAWPQHTLNFRRP